MGVERKISDYPVNQFPIQGTDIFLGARDLDGIPTTVTFQYQQLFANVNVTAVFSSNVTINSLTANTLTLNNIMTPPSSNSGLLAIGAFAFDANYLYIGVANNYIRRVALQDF